MTEKFIPTDGRALTPYEREILTILQEECAEVIVAASKLLRFGAGNTNPSTGQSNVRELSLEVGDVQRMLELVALADLVEPRAMNEGVARKSARLAIYLQNGPKESDDGRA
jgi:hypothetical protein